MQRTVLDSSRWLSRTAPTHNIYSQIRTIQTKTHHGSRERHRSTPTPEPSAPSLLKELFPSDSARSDASALPKPVREIPRVELDAGAIPVPVDSDLDDDNEPPNNIVRRPDERPRSRAGAGVIRVGDSAPTGAEHFAVGLRDKNAAVLWIRKAGNHLTPEDFRHVSPQNKHIEGWKAPGDVMKVVRGRNIDDLLPNGSYFLVFGTAVSAAFSQDRLKRLQERARVYAPAYEANFGFLTTKLGPAATTDGAGQRVPDPVESYAIAPPQQEVHARLMQQPFSPLLRSIVHQGGYPALVSNRLTDWEVLVRFDGTSNMVGIQGIKVAMKWDGINRGMKWAIKVVKGTSDKYGSQGIREVKIKARVRALDPEADNEAKDTSDSKDAEGMELTASAPTTRKVPRQFIISFASEEEARRFVMKWHRRDIMDLLDEKPYEEDAAVMNAEYIW